MFIMPIKELALEAYPVKYIDEKSYERKNPDKNYSMRKAFEEGAVSVLTELTKELRKKRDSARRSMGADTYGMKYHNGRYEVCADLLAALQNCLKGWDNEKNDVLSQSGQ